MAEGPENSESGREDASNGRVCEITPEMIEAGVSALIAFEPMFEGEAAGVERIYRAMEAARRKAQESREAPDRPFPES